MQVQGQNMRLVNEATYNRLGVDLMHDCKMINHSLGLGFNFKKQSVRGRVPPNGLG